MSLIAAAGTVVLDLLFAMLAAYFVVKLWERVFRR